MGLLKKSQVTKSPHYKKTRVMGDVWAKEKADHYFAERKKIFGYGGASKVDQRAVAFFEPFFIEANWDWWFHHADTKFLNDVLWFFRRLKVGMSRADEKRLYRDFYLRLPYHRQVFMNFDRSMLAKLKKRWKGVKIEAKDKSYPGKSVRRRRRSA